MKANPRRTYHTILFTSLNDAMLTDELAQYIPNFEVLLVYIDIHIDRDRYRYRYVYVYRYV